MLRTGEKGIIRFKFMFYPEMIRLGSRVMFREGNTKGVGFVTKVHFKDSADKQ